jgi:CRP-like cAMP-binding protein
MKTIDRKTKKTVNVNQHCATCETLTCSIIKDCSPACLDEISLVKKCNIYEKGDRILMEGAESDGVYIISSGKVKIFKSDKDGEQLIIRLAKAGEILGFNPADDSREQTVSAKALDDTVICYLDGKSFQKIVKDNPEMMYGLLKFYNKELNEVENKSLKLARMNVVSKVADALITIYQAYGTTGKNNTLNLFLSRQEIASLAGTTKEQVSKILSEFQAKGYIYTKAKQIDVLDFGALKDIARV